MSAPLVDIEAEALRVLEAARARDIILRLVGGLAVRLHAEGGLHPAFERSCRDIDVVVRQRDGQAVAGLLSELGYDGDDRFNATHGRQRMLFFDRVNDRQLDVFVGSFEMCHVLPIAERLEVDKHTVPLAELLLTKLQIVELNPKDQRDIVALMHHHEVGVGDDETINEGRVAALCAADWGLFRTTTMNLERTSAALLSSGLTPGEHAIVAARVERLSAALQKAPKGRRFRLRERVGDRVQSYEEPEDHLA